jgi:hypothetical protein
VTGYAGMRAPVVQPRDVTYNNELRVNIKLFDTRVSVFHQYRMSNVMEHGSF